MMRQHLLGLAAAMAVAAFSAPAMAGCGGCAPVVSYSTCAQPVVYGPSCGGWGYARLSAPVTYYAVEPQYYYVNQGPTYTGPGMFAPAASYQQRAVGGWSGYSVGYYGYSGGPYAHPTHHSYHGMPAVTTPTIYSYRRAYRTNVRYGYRSHHAPRVYRGPRVHYGYHYAPRHYGQPRQRALRRYY